MVLKHLGCYCRLLVLIFFLSIKHKKVAALYQKKNLSIDSNNYHHDVST